MKQADKHIEINSTAVTEGAVKPLYKMREGYFIPKDKRECSREEIIVKIIIQNQRDTSVVGEVQQTQDP